jgi:serine/threonine-protein kinase
MRSIIELPQFRECHLTDPRARLETALSDRYEVERELGQGGMATVYLAKDLRHDRRVAVKVLRPELAAVIGAERFLQEIKLTANLQHAHILPLHDSGAIDGVLFYVMPYVEGETLRSRLTREKQLEIGEAVEYARQVASALDYAHRRGIIHRDIKPENVLLHDRQALVADFGIALAVSMAGGNTRMTETGMSLGTPQYMSPEQAMGDRELDARSDIYSLGAMLYEMLAGDPPYTGSTAQAIVAKVITEKPPVLTTQRDTVPPNVAAAVHKALAKLPADRFHSAEDFAAALSNPGFTSVGTTSAMLAPVAAKQGIGGWLWPALAAVFAGVAGWALLRPAPVNPITRYGLTFPKDQELRSHPWSIFGLAPDGSWIAYVGPGPTSTQDQLWVKPRGQFEATAMAGTIDAWAPTPSPDGQSIAFQMGSQLRKIPVVGGAPITLSDSTQTFDSAVPAWGDDGIISYIDRRWRLRRVPGSGGASAVAWTPPAGRFAVLPTALPKGRGVLFGVCDVLCRTVKDVWVLDLRSGQAKLLIPGALRAWYTAGQLIYVRADGGVFAQPFDLGALNTSGAAIPVLEGVQVDGGYFPQLVPGNDGTLLYLRGPAGNSAAVAEMVWVGRDGRASPVDSSWGMNGAGNQGWALSPDGKRLAIMLVSEAGNQIWVKELDRGPVSRITFDTSGDVRPRWMPDGKTVTYLSTRGSGENQALFGRRGNGTGPEELKLKFSHPIWEAVWSRDGKWLLVRTGGIAGAQGDRDVYAMQLGVDSVPRPLLVTKADERAIALSPDARWLAYESDETGRDEIYVRPFPNVDSGKWQVSTAGGHQPLWAHNGRELFYRSEANEMMVAPVSATQGFAVADRRVLFKLGPEYLTSANYTPWDVTSDDQRFLMIRSRAGATSQRNSSLILVTNWFAELKAKTAARR